jgi:hypothetical protein
MAASRILCHQSGLPALSTRKICSYEAKLVSRQIFEREQLLDGAAMYEIIVNIPKMYQNKYHPTVPFYGLSTVSRKLCTAKSRTGRMWQLPTLCTSTPIQEHKNII